MLTGKGVVWKGDKNADGRLDHLRACTMVPWVWKAGLVGVGVGERALSPVTAADPLQVPYPVSGLAWDMHRTHPCGRHCPSWQAGKAGTVST